MKRKSFLLLPLLLLGMSLAACHGTSKDKSSDSSKTDDTPTVDPTPTPTPSTDVAVSSVSLNKNTLTLEVNASETLVATVNPSNATNKTVTWTSSEPTIASVTSNGLVKGLAGGRATITAAAGGKSATCIVTVNEPAPVVKYTVSFDAGEGTGTMTSVEVEAGSYTLPACTFTAPEGKEFAGWLVGNVVKAAGETISLSANVQLVAQWRTPAPVINAHTLRNFTTEQNYAMESQKEGAEYYVRVALALNDIFKIKMSEDDEDWRGYADFKTVGEGSAHASFEESDGNVKCLKAGTYDFYVAVSKDADDNNPGKSIWVAEHLVPERTGWKAVLNGANKEVTLNQENDQEIMYSATLAADDQLVFQNADGSKEQGYDQLKNGQNDFTKGENNELVVKAAGAYQFYINLTEAKGIWAIKDGEPLEQAQGGGEGGGENPQQSTVPAHTLRVFGESPVNHALTAKQDESEYYIIGLQFADNDVFKIKMSEDDSDWRGITALKTGGASANFVDDESNDHNIKVTTGGKFNVYVAVTPDAEGVNQGKSIWIEEYVDRTGWKAVVNGADQAVSNSADNLKQIEIKNVELEVGDTIIFQNADGSKKQGFAQIKETNVKGLANFEAGENNELKATAAGTYDFYVEISETKGIWVVKQGAADQIEVKLTVVKDVGMGNAVYLVGDFCNWSVTDANVIKFSYVTDHWEVTINVDVDTVYHCKLVKAAYENPSSISEWEKTGEGNERTLTFTEAGTIALDWGNY